MPMRDGGLCAGSGKSAKSARERLAATNALRGVVIFKTSGLAI
jgi:hypothetical protein